MGLPSPINAPRGYHGHADQRVRGAAHAQSIPLVCDAIGPFDHFDDHKGEEYTTAACSAAGGVLGRWDSGGGIQELYSACCNTPASRNDTFYSACEAASDHYFNPWPWQLKEPLSCNSQ